MESSTLFQNAPWPQSAQSRASTAAGEGMSSSWPTSIEAACQIASQAAAMSSARNVFFMGSLLCQDSSIILIFRENTKPPCVFGQKALQYCRKVYYMRHYSEDALEVLQKCPLFSGFEKEEISILLQRAKGRQCKMKKGEKVPAGQLGLLLSGRLCIKGQAADSREIQLNHVLPGAAFCAAAPFLEGPALSDIYAEIASEVLLLSAEQLWSMMDDSPLFRKNYIVFLGRRGGMPAVGLFTAEAAGRRFADTQFQRAGRCAGHFPGFALSGAGRAGLFRPDCAPGRLHFG